MGAAPPSLPLEAEVGRAGCAPRWPGVNFSDVRMAFCCTRVEFGFWSQIQLLYQLSCIGVMYVAVSGGVFFQQHVHFYNVFTF